MDAKTSVFIPRVGSIVEYISPTSEAGPALIVAVESPSDPNSRVTLQAFGVLSTDIVLTWHGPVVRASLPNQVDSWQPYPA